MRLYIGNLPYKATEADLESWFSQAGIAVDSVNVVRDRFSGEARGFGFAEIANDQEAGRAISSCNGKQFMGRPLVINEARPMASGGGRAPAAACSEAAQPVPVGPARPLISGPRRRRIPHTFPVGQNSLWRPAAGMDACPTDTPASEAPPDFFRGAATTLLFWYSGSHFGCGLAAAGTGAVRMRASSLLMMP